MSTCCPGGNASQAKLRDHKYPAQNHGMAMAGGPGAAASPGRRELDESLMALPATTRRTKPLGAAYGSPLAKSYAGGSRQARRPDVSVG